MTSYTFTPGSARSFVKADTWLHDAYGRYALFRGVNFSGRSKLPPYIPVMPLATTSLDSSALAAELAAVQPQLELLRQLGLNIVRLPVMWKGIEPTPNSNLSQLLPAGTTYLGFVKEIIDNLYSQHDLFVLIDFHQDIASGTYGGDGFPDWALAVDAAHPLPAPVGFTNSGWGLLYYANNTPWYDLDDLVRWTLRSFWMNSLTNTNAGLSNFPVRTHLEKTIGQTAAFFQGHPAVLGYELFNEPAQVGIDKQTFETQMLPTFYQNAALEIALVDENAFFFVEPRVDWTTYNATAPEPVLPLDTSALNFTYTPQTFLNVSGLASGRTVFAFHYYDPQVLFNASLPGGSTDMAQQQTKWPGAFADMMQAATSRDLVPFITEFGGSQDWQYSTDLSAYSTQIRAYMDLQFREIESVLCSAIYWQYDLYNTAANKDNWNLENFSLLGPNRTPRETDIVARPYPLRSSAKPSLLFFDLTSLHAAIMLSGPVLMNAPTVIYVPFAAHYSNGMEVYATSSTIEWDATRQFLYWYPDPSKSVNQVVICPAHAFSASHLPQQVQNLLAQTPLSLCWPGQLRIQVLPTPVPAAKATSITVEVKDLITQSPVAATVLIHNFTASGQATTVTIPANQPSPPIAFYAKTTTIGDSFSPAIPPGGPNPPDKPVTINPFATVSAANYLNTNFTFNLGSAPPLQ